MFTVAAVLRLQLRVLCWCAHAESHPGYTQCVVCVHERPRPVPYWTASLCALCMMRVRSWSVVTETCVNDCVLFKVWKISLQGPCYMTLLMIAFGLLWGHLLQIRPTQSVFISTCLSLSSTPLVSRFLVGSARGEKEGR